MNTQLLYNLQDVNLLVKLALGILEDEVFSLLSRSAAATISFVEPSLAPNSFVFVATESASPIDLVSDPFFVIKAVFVQGLKQTYGRRVLTMPIIFVIFSRVQSLDKAVVHAEALHSRDRQKRKLKRQRQQRTEVSKNVVKSRPT